MYHFRLLCSSDARNSEGHGVTRVTARVSDGKLGDGGHVGERRFGWLPIIMSDTLRKERGLRMLQGTDLGWKGALIGGERSAALKGVDMAEALMVAKAGFRMDCLGI